MSAKREPCASDDAFADEDVRAPSIRAPSIRTPSNLLTEIEIYFQLSYTASGRFPSRGSSQSLRYLE